MGMQQAPMGMQQPGQAQIGMQQPQYARPTPQHLGDSPDLGDDDDLSMVNPLDHFTMEDYRKWNLDIISEKLTQTFDGRSENYDGWKELMIDVCSTQWFGWRFIL